MPAKSLKILHVVRAPTGGLFRHVVDLANGQVSRGHKVGIVADSLTGGERANRMLGEMAPRLALGVHRFAIRREPHPADILLWPRFSRLVETLAPDVLHGHGSKAGAFVRLKRRKPGMIRVYTPHGGSLHYGPHTAKGKLYGLIERSLMNRTELFLFESKFADTTYRKFIGSPRGPVRLVFNGVTDAEFAPVETATDAADVAFIGELRDIKGPDILIDALGLLKARGQSATATIAGEGDAADALRAQCDRLGLASAVKFIGYAPARHTFSLGRMLAVPSRGDSMPYVVIEAAAAGIPMIAASVGGIPEIFGEFSDCLVPPNDAQTLANAIAATLAQLGQAQERAMRLQERIRRHFSQDAMVEGVLAAYRAARGEH